MRIPSALRLSEPRPRHCGRLARFSRADSGVAAVEFAMVLPVIVLLYLGMTELAQGISVDRKVTLLSRTLSDLVAQAATINSTEMDNTFAAATTVLSPYTTAPDMVISSIMVDAAKVAKVDWSCAKNGGTKRAKDSTVTLPTGLDAANTSIIMAEVKLTHKPMLGHAFFKADLELSETTYMRPRLVSSLASPGAACN